MTAKTTAEPVPTADEPDEGAPTLRDVYYAVLSLTDLVQALLDVQNPTEHSQIVVHA